MDFDDAKNNFFAAAQHGLKAQFSWVDGKTHTAAELISGHLLPMAEQGLRSTGIDTGDIDRYLGVIGERVKAEKTGASWMLASLSGMGSKGTPDLRYRQLTATIKDNQCSGAAVHDWPLAVLDDKRDRNWRSSYQTVGQIMSTDLFTVRPDDIVDLAASVMEWSHIRHVPVEDEEGRLVGLVSHRSLLRLIARGGGDEMVDVSSIMRTDPVTVPADMRTVDAIHLMRDQQVACLPVIEDDKLIGMITERDLIVVSARLLEDFLNES
jgi:CBS domain-containing protein